PTEWLRHALRAGRAPDVSPCEPLLGASLPSVPVSTKAGRLQSQHTPPARRRRVPAAAAAPTRAPAAIRCATIPSGRLSLRSGLLTTTPHAVRLSSPVHRAGRPTRGR